MENENEMERWMEDESLLCTAATGLTLDNNTVWSEKGKERKVKDKKGEERKGKAPKKGNSKQKKEGNLKGEEREVEQRKEGRAKRNNTRK